MRVAKQLRPEDLQIDIDHQRTDLGSLFPTGHLLDRFESILTEPYGNFGARLLVQAAIMQCYEIAPQRRNRAPMYPEIYIFHDEGRFGDYSSFDFWLARKEVFIPAEEPTKLLSAIVDRAITRLAVPEQAPGDPAALATGTNSFADIAAARNGLASGFVYHPHGSVAEPDVTLASDHAAVENNIVRTFDREVLLAVYEERPETFDRPGPTTTRSGQRD